MIKEEVKQEIEALQAIYGDDCFFYRESAWGRHGPPSFAIVVAPMDKNANSSVTLRFTLSGAYPKAIPVIEIEKSNGLSVVDIKDLNARLIEVAKRHVGQVMCHEIADFALNFLRERYEMPQTLYEVMVDREKKEEKALQDILLPATNVAKSARKDPTIGKVRSEYPVPALPVPVKRGHLLKGEDEDDDDAIENSIKMNDDHNGRNISPRLDLRDEDEESSDSNPELPKRLSNTDLLAQNANNGSRYAQEFTELSLLGSGASGEVWKVRNKLDRRVYAVKKIFITSHLNDSAIIGRKIRREVTTISRLLHKNIVRYYAAWVENQTSVVKQSASEGESDSGRNAESTTSSQDDVLKAIPTASQKLSIMNLNDDIFDFEIDGDDAPADESSTDDYDDQNSDESSDSSDSTIFFGSSGAPTSPKQESGSGKQSKPSKRCLFIQMEFCCSTLRQLIDEGKIHNDHFAIIKLLRQTLDALAYIHGRGVIHRDLKPANIFLDAESNIKIGDFGLATSGRRSEDAADDANQIRIASDWAADITNSQSNNNVSLVSDDQSLTNGVGTAMYRAPEQGGCVMFASKMSGASLARQPYNEKADMYSIGVILFEMCHSPFVTGTERILTLQALKEKGIFPKGFGGTLTPGEDGKIADFCKIIQLLLQLDPAKRPSASELLASPLLPSRADADESYLKEITDGLNSFPLRRGVVAELFRYGTTSKGGSSSLDSANDLPFFYYGEELWKSHNLLLPKLPIALQSSVYIKKLLQERNWTFKDNSGLSTRSAKFGSTTLSVLNCLKRTCSQQFELFGAVDFQPPLFQLYDQHSGPSGLIKMMDSCGQVVTLPTNLTTQFARFSSLLQCKSAVRYCIGNVFSTPSTKNRGAEEAIEASQGYGDIHPQSSTEASFDIIYPLFAVDDEDANGNAPSDSEIMRLLAESEAISAAVNCLLPFHSHLPEYAIRISDYRIFDCILEFCAWPLSSPTSSVKNPEGKQNASTSTQTKQRPEPGFFSPLGIDKAKLLRCISLAVDADFENNESATDFLAELNLPLLFLKRLSPFVKILTSQGAKFGKPGPLEVLNLLSQEFFRTDVVVGMQRSAARETVEQLQTPKKKSGDTTPAQHSGPKVSQPKSSNFEPIKIENIGVKAVKAKSTEKKSNSITSVFPASKTANLNGYDVEQVGDLIKSFDSAMKHLKALVEMLLSSKALAFETLIIDIGIDPRHPPYCNGSVFASGCGVYFIVEAYSMALSNRVNRFTPVSTGVNESQNSSVKIVPQRKRHKGWNGILAEGGHFEQHLQLPEPYNIRSTAFGIRLRLESITNLIFKKIVKTKINEANEINRGVSQTTLSSGSIPLVFVLSSSEEINFASSILTAENYIPESAAHVFQVCEELRSRGVSAIGYLHELLRGIDISDDKANAPTGATLVTVCKSVGIAFIVQVVATPQTTINDCAFKIQPLSSISTYGQSFPVKTGHIHTPETKISFSELASVLVQKLLDVDSINDRTSLPAESSGGARKQAISGATRPSSDASKNALGGSKKPPAKLSLPSVKASLIIVETAESDATSREARKTSNKNKIREALRLKVAMGLKHCTAVGSFDRGSGGEEVEVEILVSKSSEMLHRTARPLIVAVEIPFKIVRALNTIIMSHAQQASSSSQNALASKEEFEALCSNEASAKYRKQMKQLIVELASFAKYVKAGEPASQVQASDASHFHVQKGMNSNTHGSLVQIHVFCLIDDKMDSVTFDPIILSYLKWI